MRIAFLYGHNMAHEFAQFEAGLVPSHRLFGAADVGKLGAEAEYFAWPTKWPRRLRSPSLWRLYQAGALCAGQRHFAAAVCTTEAPAPPVLLLRRLGILRRPVIVLTVAALKNANRAGLRGRVMAWLLRGADQVCAYASHQVPQLVATFRLDPARVRFLPLGVDPDFFPPIATADGAPYVLSVGTNEGKDFPTLLDALPPDAECLIVTDEQNEAAARRHGLPAGVTVRTHVPITELRDLYRRARHVVIPLRESDASSGQTVLLENLVSGRPVIVSRVSGVADYLAETGAVPVAPGDPAALRELLATPPRMPAAETTEYVRARFSSAAFARNLLALISG